MRAFSQIYKLIESHRKPNKYVILILPLTTTGSYANSLDPDKTPSNSGSHPDQSCLTPRQHFH